MLVDGVCVEARDFYGAILENINYLLDIAKNVSELGFCRYCVGGNTLERRVCTHSRCADCLWEYIATRDPAPGLMAGAVTWVLRFLKDSQGRLEHKVGIQQEGRLWQMVFAAELVTGKGSTGNRIRISLETTRPDRIIQEAFINVMCGNSVPDGATPTVLKIRRGISYGFCACAVPGPETIRCAPNSLFCAACALQQIFICKR